MSTYQAWLERTALEFLENRDQDLEVFLDKLESNFFHLYITEKGIAEILSELSQKIDELR